MTRGHRLNTSIVLAAVHGLSGLFRAVSAVEPSLCRPLPTLSPSLVGHLASVEVKHQESMSLWCSVREVRARVVRAAKHNIRGNGKRQASCNTWQRFEQPVRFRDALRAQKPYGLLIRYGVGRKGDREQRGMRVQSTSMFRKLLSCALDSQFRESSF